MTINNVSQAQSGAQEALESVAQTKSEAAKGDAQAARKLAAAQSRQADPSPPEGTGQVLNASA